MKTLRVTRPDGTVLYKHVLNQHETPLLLGTLMVVDGKIVVHPASMGDRGGVVRPGCEWGGSMSFEIREDEQARE